MQTSSARALPRGSGRALLGLTDRGRGGRGAHQGL